MTIRPIQRSSHASGHRPGHRRFLARHRSATPAAGPTGRRHRARRWSALAATTFVIATTGLAVGGGSAAAAEISTDYPAVDVQAGQSVTLDLNLSAKKLERVDLSVADAPDGWTADLQGGGFTIGGAYVGPDQTPSVQLHVAVPAKAQTGTYHVIVDADAPSGNKKLDVEFDVVKQASNAFALTTQFDKLQGSTTDSFDFSLELANNTGKKATFGLTAQGPKGWTVTASPSSQNKASAVEVDGGATSDLTVSAKPPDNVEAGTYPIAVTAQGAGVELHAKLSVEVTGSPTLSLATSNQVLNASGSAGETTDMHLVVSNTGTAPLQGVTMSSTPPTDWKVTFEPSTIDSIAPGKSADVVAHIQPSGDAITGDYQLPISAKSDASDGSVTLRYTIETSSWWGLVGIIVIAVVVVGLLWMFRRFGRR